MESEEIYQKYYASLYLFILKRVKNEVISEDILQSTFLKIHEKKSQLKDPTKLKHWIFQIVRNEIIDHFNSQKPKIVDVLPSEATEDGACCLHRFIDELPDLYRNPIQMVYLEGKSQNETAEKLGISLAAIKGRIRRAKEILKEKFKICCKYSVDGNNQLIGQADCQVCNK